MSVNTPWKDNVIAAVLNVESIYIDHKGCTENFVTFYGENCLFKAVYYSYVQWKKNENDKPHKEVKYSELEHLTMIIQGVHIDTLNKVLSQM